jgi:hypothetical protein
MAKIRQEINILDVDNSAASGLTSDSKQLAQLDTTQYSGTVTYYFEIVGDTLGAGNATVTLRRKGTTTDDASITVSATTITRSRVSFTPPAGQTEYFVHSVANVGFGMHCVSARIIVIQNGTLSTTETQIEIGNNETAKVNTTSSPLTTPKYWLYTAANWDGTKSFYAEVTSSTVSSNTHTITLQEDNGSFASWVDKVTIVSAITGTTATRRRSVAFTPTDGRHYRIAGLSSSSMNGWNIYNAKIIVDSQEGGVSVTAGGSGILAPAGGTATSGQTGQAIAQAFQVRTSTVLTAVHLWLAKSGSPTDTLKVDIVSTLGGTSLANATISGSTLTGSNADTTFTFSSPPTLSSGTTYYIQLSRSPDTFDNVNLYDTGTIPNSYGNGTAWIRTNNTWSQQSSSYLAFLLTGASFTLLEAQYMLLNTADAGTGLQKYQTLYDSTEWDAGSGSITYEHAMDSDNASNSAKLQDIDNSNTDVTSSSVTGANQQISSAMTMPTTGHQIDVNVTNSTGTVAASRILAIYAFAAASGPTPGNDVSMWGQPVNQPSVYQTKPIIVDY